MTSESLKNSPILGESRDQTGSRASALGRQNGDKSAWPNAIQRARLEAGGSEAARSVALSDET